MEQFDFQRVHGLVV